jgi:RNA polymerase sigma-70 factor (ECF subfamily)
VSLDADDISRLYRSHARAMLTFFARRTYDPETAVDLVAETFAAAFASRHQFRGDSDEEAGAWVYGIARHQLSALFRKGQVERRALSRLEVERRALTDPEYERIEQLADLAELRNLVAERLAELPAEHRRIVGLRIVEERSYADIAAALDISEQTARARVSRALRALAVQLEAAPQADVEVTDRG